nr:MAG TPA: hypothetical protein [Caudoviricetes sp.]
MTNYAYNLLHNFPNKLVTHVSIAFSKYFTSSNL